MRTRPLATFLFILTGCSAAELPTVEKSVRSVTEWPAYGGDIAGQRNVASSIIHRSNVTSIGHAWTYRHGDVSGNSDGIPSTTAFENTPILVDGTLFFCTPFNRVIALDPVTGAEQWVHDPGIDLTGRYANQLICRGVTAWLDDKAGLESPCRRTIFTATNDARLVALDARTGNVCEGFGSNGEVDLNAAAGRQKWKGEYQVTSPPVVVGDVVVVGSAVSDNVRIDAPSGVVRGFDARSGMLRWAWDLAPPDFDYDTDLVSETLHAVAGCGA